MKSGSAQILSCSCNCQPNIYTEMNHIPRTFYPVRDCILVALQPFSPIFMPRRGCIGIREAPNGVAEEGEQLLY